MYAMYDPAGQDSAPKVRIRLLSEALAERADLTLVSGTPGRRFRSLLRWLLREGMGAVDAVYVETATAAVLPHDLALFAWARLRGRPLGIYFRDAYQRFRQLYPVATRRQRLSDLAWRLTFPIARRLATVRFAPSAGLAHVLRLPSPVLLPPGTDPRLPFLGAGHGPPLVAAIAAPAPASDVPFLMSEMAIVHQQRPAVRLRIVSRAERPADWPSWVEVVAADRDGLAEALEPAALCVIPLRRTSYTDLAVSVRLTDLLALGKPTVASASLAAEAFVGPSEAVAFVSDAPGDLAAAIVR